MSESSSYYKKVPINADTYSDSIKLTGTYICDFLVIYRMERQWRISVN